MRWPTPGTWRLRTWVNGELRQDSSTSDLIFKCPELVQFISQTCTLAPGDLILTGTPHRAKSVRRWIRRQSFWNPTTQCESL